MPIHPDYKMLSDEDVNMQLAEGIYDQNDPSLFNADEWARNKYGTKQIPLTQPQQQTLQQNIDAYTPETNNVNRRNWYQSQMSGAEKDYRGIPQSQPLPLNAAPEQQGADPAQVLEYLSQKYPQAKSLVEKARAKKQGAVRNEVFPDQRIVGRVPPIPGVDKERAFGMQDPFQMVKKSPSDMNEQEYKAYIAKLNELSRPDYVQKSTNYEFGNEYITGQVPPEERARNDYYDGLPEWGGNEPMISEQVGEVTPRSEIVEQDLPPEIDPRLENTTIGKMAMSAKDPRLLMAHLAQFAGEFGNLRGKPTESTAMPFYQAQIALEQQQRDNAFKQQQLDTQRYAEDIKAKKTEQGSDPALAALRRVQTDLAFNKLQTEQELLDPNSERSQNLRETMRELAARQGYTFPKNDSLRGADALKMITALMQEMQMSAQMGRTVYTTEAAVKEKEADRKLKEQMAADNAKLQKELADLRRKAGIDIKQTIPGKAASTGGTGTQKAFTNTSALRKEYQSHPITKKTMEISDSFNKIKSVFQTGTAGGDMSGVFMFMKLLDPGSTVREGEYKSAAEATGALDRLMNYKDKLEKGTILNPSQRQDFMQIAEKFYKAQMKEQNRLNQEFTDLASKSGLDPKDLMLLTGEKRKAKSIDELPDVKK